MVETVSPSVAPATGPKGCLKKSKYADDAVKKDPFETEEPTESAVDDSVESGKENGEATYKVGTKPERPKMNAHFGSVRIAWHRMTLGAANPGGTKGVPLTLGELEEAERYETVDNFSQKFHYTADGVHEEKKKQLDRMTESMRRVIALKHHTEDEIAEVEKEVGEVTGERKQSRKEVEIKAFLEYKKTQREAEAAKKKPKTKTVGGGGLFSCFGRS
eukprot:scaffold1522_cov166-Amphora_coffeaeformis.AAC.30